MYTQVIYCSRSLSNCFSVKKKPEESADAETKFDPTSHLWEESADAETEFDKV